jgi:hypothetical protein
MCHHCTHTDTDTDKDTQTDTHAHTHTHTRVTNSCGSAQFQHDSRTVCKGLEPAKLDSLANKNKIKKGHAQGCVESTLYVRLTG